MTRDNLSSWWKLVIGILIGAIAPSLITWGAMATKIETNKLELTNKLNISTFEEYKDGNNKLLKNIQQSLVRIEGKLDTK